MTAARLRMGGRWTSELGRHREAERVLGMVERAEVSLRVAWQNAESAMRRADADRHVWRATRYATFMAAACRYVHELLDRSAL